MASIAAASGTPRSISARWAISRSTASDTSRALASTFVQRSSSSTAQSSSSPMPMASNSNLSRSRLPAFFTISARWPNAGSSRSNCSGARGSVMVRLRQCPLCCAWAMICASIARLARNDHAGFAVNLGSRVLLLHHTSQAASFTKVKNHSFAQSHRFAPFNNTISPSQDSPTFTAFVDQAIFLSRRIPNHSS